MEEGKSSSSSSESGYFFYKKEFSENGSVDDLFGFEFE